MSLHDCFLHKFARLQDSLCSKLIKFNTESSLGYLQHFTYFKKLSKVNTKLQTNFTFQICGVNDITYSIANPPSHKKMCKQLTLDNWLE